MRRPSGPWVEEERLQEEEGEDHRREEVEDRPSQRPWVVGELP
jgi:hypothetical protein